ncbi:MAG: hypothetical protein ACW990_10215 [Promethearchaeota archaeon]|jgi:hypothetical protein
MDAKTYWAPLFHIYQPPNQDLQVLKDINQECYKPLFSLLDEYDTIKFSLNVSGVLIELFYEFGLSDTMDLLKNLVSKKKIEIVGTAKFHPILPLIPKKEAKRQIQINEEINRREFGQWQRSGFFPPELAISGGVAKLIKQLGYKWVIMSGIACPIDWPYDQIYCSPNGLQLFFRDDILSNKISFKNVKAKQFVNSIKEIFQPDEKQKTLSSKKLNRYIITAMDGETFGHHIRNYERTFLKKVIDFIKDDEEIETLFISELDQYFPISSNNIVPRESSWSTSFEDIQKGVPYPLWKHPKNEIHKYYWKLMNSVNNLMNLIEDLDLTQEWQVENYSTTARYFYDRGIYSCPVWWANPQYDTWSPNLIYKGLESLMRAALNAQIALVYANKSELGEGYFNSISYYHGLLLMEISNITQLNFKRQNETGQ